jgi:hypothetical protein
VCIFFIFRSSKIRVSPTSVVSSLFPPRYRISSGWHHHVAASCHASFPLRQDELIVPASSFDNILPCRLSSQVKTEALNLHHRRRLPSPDRLILTLHCYKKIISNLDTLLTTQQCLYFASTIARTPYHQKSIRRHSLSLLFYTYYPSTQRHSRWWISRSSFTFQITYRYINSHKYIL